MAKTNDYCYVVIETWYEEPTHDIHVVGTFRTEAAALKHVNKAIAGYIAENAEDIDESEEAYEISNHSVKSEGVVYSAHSVSEANEMPQTIVIHKQRLKG